MTPASKFMFLLLVGITGLFILLVVPFGWLFLAFSAFLTMIYYVWIDDYTRPDRTSCAACGAPNPPARETCKHCDDPL